MSLHRLTADDNLTVRQGATPFRDQEARYARRGPALPAALGVGLAYPVTQSVRVHSGPATPYDPWHARSCPEGDPTVRGNLP